MATKTNFYLNGSKINPPKNWQELEIELNFDRDKDSAQSVVSINDWEFVRENSDYILKWINDGLTTGPGIFEGIPFKLEIERNGQIENPFDGYLDLTELPQLSCNRSTVKAKEREQIDWLNDIADSFTFEYLYKETGEITNNDFVFVPYVINSVPDYKEAALMLISVFVIGEQITSSIEKIVELIAEMSNPFEATAIIRAVLFIIYLTALIISIIKLIKDLIQMIIQPVKYHAGMRTKDLLRIGAAHLGLTFKSEIFEEDPFSKEIIIPPKYNNPVNLDDDRFLGFTIPNKTEQEGYYKGTFGDLLRAQKEKHNAKIVITSNNELYLVRNDYNVSQPQFQLPDIRQPFFTTNANEFQSNYLVEFQTDLSDKNTIQEYQGTIYQIITQPKTYNNRDLVLMKGLKQVNIPFALAKRKESLSVPERIVKAFLDVFSGLINGLYAAVNGLIAVYNKIVKQINKIIKALGTIGINLSFEIKPIKQLDKVDLAASIENRIGMMKIETDFFNIHKVLILDEGSQPKYNKIPIENKIFLSAKYLYANYHISNSFIPDTDRPFANQRIIKEFEKVPFCFDDYIAVKNSNMCFDADGGEAEIEYLKWNIYNQHADMRVRFKQLYTNNLTIIELEPNGR